MTDTTDGWVRAGLALLVVAGALAIFAFTDKLDFAQLLAITGPVTALYFGQYIARPGEATVSTDEPVPVVVQGEPVEVVNTPAKKPARKRR